MVASRLERAYTSPYTGCCFVLTTKHHKSIAIAPPFKDILGAAVLEHVIDTDTLGTFSGEIERLGTALDTAKKKCEWSIKNAEAEYALASEGSFGPHPVVGFAPCNQEILYFIDQQKKFQLYVTDLYTETNYQMGEVSYIEELMIFAKRALFPSHALIIRPSPRDNSGPIFKGIQTLVDLEAAFLEASKLSIKNKVWVETDMRAHLNPTRMKVIGTLAEKLARRLCCLCPRCSTPGWGRIDAEQGLPCAWCGMATNEIKYEIFACVKCEHRQSFTPAHGKQAANPERCAYCNP